MIACVRVICEVRVSVIAAVRACVWSDLAV